MVFSDVNTKKGLNELNAHLSEHSYITGYQLSADDLKTFDSFAKAPEASVQNVFRWYNHVKSYSAEERKAVTGGACPLAAGAKTTTAPPAAKPAPAAAKPAAADDDDLDLFGSDNEEEDAEAARIREERLKAYADKKSKKPVLIAKSSIVLDVKPWDDTTNMQKVEEQVRTIIMEGLVWGASKLVPVGYGIMKLQIMCVVEDDKVSIDELVEKIQDFEEYVQSVDIAAFNKI